MPLFWNTYNINCYLIIHNAIPMIKYGILPCMTSGYQKITTCRYWRDCDSNSDVKCCGYIISDRHLLDGFQKCSWNMSLLDH